jgi:iron complex outermembrane recepter protein
LYGLETWGSYLPLTWWRLDAGLTLQHEHFGFVPGSSGPLGVAQVGDDPYTQARLRSSMDFGKASFDANFRYVGMLPNPAVPAYVELDSRLAWRIAPTTENRHIRHESSACASSGMDHTARRRNPRMVFLELRQSF